MARIGGRNLGFAWFIGILSLGAVALLVFLAAPMLPSVLSWAGGIIFVAEPTPTPTPPTADELKKCEDLAGESLSDKLAAEHGFSVIPSRDAPVTSATAFVAALKPTVSITCTWHSDEGTLSATRASVGTDAGSIAQSGLPARGFTCEQVSGRVVCTRASHGDIETISAGGGTWLSTSEKGWHPEQFADQLAATVWK